MTAETKADSGEPVRLGLVGLGWGSRVAEAARAAPGVGLDAVYSSTQSTREAFAGTHGVRACETFEHLIADDSLHGIVIMTPNRTHCRLAIEAMRAGRHVLVTKPIATTLSDAAEMIRVSRGTGRILTVGHQSRRHPALRRLKQLIEAGELGEVCSIEGNTSSPTGLAVDVGNWRNNPHECPGGPLMQLGIHYVDNYQHLLGPARTVSAWMGKTGRGAVDPDTTMSLLGFNSNVTGYLGSSYVAAKTRWIRMTGAQGTALFQDGSLTLQVGARTTVLVPPAREPELVLQQMLAEEIAEFVQCIRTGAAPEIGGGTAARNLAVVLAAVESSRRRAPVDVDELLRAAGLPA